MRKIVTSESVNCGHPDKTCDIIADTFLDEALKQDKNCQMAVECAIKDDLLMIYGEATTSAVIDYEKIARQKLSELGYKNEFKIMQTVSKQSPNISKAVKKQKLCANDQGIMFGYATNENKFFLPYPIVIAHRLMKVFDDFRHQNNNYFADAKSQVSIVYEEGIPKEIDTILMSVSHKKGLKHSIIEKDLKENVVLKVFEEFSELKNSQTKLVLNPSKDFYVWGSFADSGCVGRKIVVDTYGGVGRVGGGCFSSKNATKVDRSGAYYARYVAKSIVAHGLADKCEIALSYAIGLKAPLSIEIETFNTNKIEDEKIKQIIIKNFNFNVSSIISELNLLQPIYSKTSCYGHFGKDDLPWEKIKALKF